MPVPCSPGQVVEGAVSYVGPRFIKVRVGQVVVFVPPPELAESFVEDAAKLFTEGDDVELVIKEPSDRHPGEWVGSLARLVEARRRQAIEHLEIGTRVEGVVREVTPAGLSLACGVLEIWVPKHELSWRWLDHPSEIAAPGTTLAVQVTGMHLPDGWLMAQRPRGLAAKVYGSVRSLIPRPEVPEVTVYAQGLRLGLTAKARVPRECDASPQFVLERLAEGVPLASIEKATGLKGRVLDRIVELLTSHSLVAGAQVTRSGLELVQALGLERELASDAIPVYFLSAAPPDARLSLAPVPDGTHAYPASWPNPLFDGQEERRLRGALAEHLAHALQLLATLPSWSERFVHLNQQGLLDLRLAPSGVSRVACAFRARQTWLLDALWEAFNPAGCTPFRADKPERHPCRAWTMLRLDGVFVEPERGTPSNPLFVEPFSGTVWTLRESARAVVNSGERPVDDLDFIRRDRSPHLDTWLRDASLIQWCKVRVPR